MYSVTISVVLSLTVVTQYDGFQRCPPHSCLFSSGCFMNNHLAILPFIILTMFGIKNCGLQYTSTCTCSGIISNAVILNLYSSAILYIISLHSSTTFPLSTCFLYFVQKTIWYCNEYTYPLPYESVLLLLVFGFITVYKYYHLYKK